jgi:hypothetical protein
MVDGLLFALTSVINFVCLTVSLWLGFYIVTRSPRLLPGSGTNTSYCTIAMCWGSLTAT